METFSPKRRNADGTGLASLVDFFLANARVVLGVSGAAVLALATLAVKRLIDRATSPPDEEEDDMKAKQKSLEDSWQELSLSQTVPKPQLALSRETLEEPLLLPVVSGTAQEPEDAVPSSETLPVEPKLHLCLTLQEKLLAVYRERVSASEATEILGKQLSEDICAKLQNSLQKYSKLPFGNAFLSGDLCDGLVGGGKLAVNFVLPLVLESDLWAPIPGEQTVVNDPRFWMIKRMGLEYFLRGSSPWDRFIVGGYLSSNGLADALRKVMEASINWPAIGTTLECVVRPVVAPEELKLEVRHERIQLEITLCPMTEAGDKTLLAAASKQPAENLWQQSFYAAEVCRLKDLDAGDSGVRLCCLRLLKAIFGNHACWRKLTSSHLMHILLHLSETESDWSEAALAERFQQALEELLRYLEEGSLPCYFDSRINLLGHLSLEEIDEIGYLLYETLAESDLWNRLGL